VNSFWRIVLFSLSAAQISADSYDAGENFRSAMTAFKEKNFYSARLLLQEIILKDPRGDLGDDAQYYVAMTYYYEGDYKTAQFEFKSLERDFPASPFVARSRFWKGEAWFYRKGYREALESHHKYVREFRENILAASALYTIGYIYNEQKRYDEAQEIFSRALKDYPETTAAPALTLQLGIAYFNAGEHKSARRSFETLLVKFVNADNLDSARFWLAKSFYAEKDYTSAYTQFRNLIKEYPESRERAEAYYLAALCLYRQNKPGDALSMIDELTRLYPQSTIYPFARIRQAQLFIETGRPEAALSPLLDIINNHRSHETFAAALDLMAEVRIKQGKTDEALATFAALIAEKDLSKKARLELLRRYADNLYKAGQFTRSAEIYGELALLESDESGKSEAELSRARALFRDQKYEAALQSLKNYNEAPPQAQAEAIFLKAEISYALGKFPEALQLYARVVKKYPAHAKIFDAELGIGWTYFELKQFARAADSFKKILKKFKKPSEQAKALLALGNALYNLRDLDGAEAAYTKIRKEFQKENIESAEALYQLAWLKFRRGDLKGATTHFDQYLSLGGVPRHAEAEYFLAQSVFQLGEFERAETILTELYASGRAQGGLKERVLPDLGKTRSQLKNFSGAREAYELYAKEFPEGSLIGEARFHIATLSLKLNDEANCEKVLEIFRKSDMKSPWHRELLIELSDYYRRKKDFARAGEYIDEATKIASKPQEKHENRIARAELFAEQGKEDLAKKELENLLAEEEISEATTLKAVTLLFRLIQKAGDFKAGEEWADKLTARFADNNKIADEILLAQAELRFVSRNFRGVREILSDLLKSRAVGQRAKFLVARSYLAEEDNGRALDYFRQISAKDDAALWSKARFHIGEILFNRREFDEAAREFSRIAYAESRDASIYEKALYLAARSFFELKKKKEYDSFRAKLAEAFSQSEYLKALPTEVPK